MDYAPASLAPQTDDRKRTLLLKIAKLFVDNFAVPDDPTVVDWRREDITFENEDVTWETETLPVVP